MLKSAFLALPSIAVLLAGPGCAGLLPPPPCPTEDPSAVINVAGVYSYFGTRPLSLVGTITLEQEGNLVRVTETTYANANNRNLMGQGTMQGNRLDIQLAAQNGTSYQADVTFIFSEDGNEFCVGFSDTNGDNGPLGSYRGSRVSS